MLNILDLKDSSRCVVISFLTFPEIVNIGTTLREQFWHYTTFDTEDKPSRHELFCSPYYVNSKSMVPVRNFVPNLYGLPFEWYDDVITRDGSQLFIKKENSKPIHIGNIIPAITALYALDPDPSASLENYHRVFSVPNPIRISLEILYRNRNRYTWSPRDPLAKYFQRWIDASTTSPEIAECLVWTHT